MRWRAGPAERSGAGGRLLGKGHQVSVAPDGVRRIGSVRCASGSVSAGGYDGPAAPPAGPGSRRRTRRRRPVRSRCRGPTRIVAGSSARVSSARVRSWGVVTRTSLVPDGRAGRPLTRPVRAGLVRGVPGGALALLHPRLEHVPVAVGELRRGRARRSRGTPSSSCASKSSTIWKVQRSAMTLRPTRSRSRSSASAAWPASRSWSTASCSSRSALPVSWWKP